MPRYFEKDIQSGVPTLTQAGRDALDEELKHEDEDEDKDKDKDTDAGGRDVGNDDNDASTAS